MTRRVARTAIPVTIDRNFAATMFGETVKAVHASGVVDDVQMWDQLTSWWPRSLWTPENTPMAELQPDPHSFGDVFLLSGHLSHAAPAIIKSELWICPTWLPKAYAAEFWSTTSL